MAALIVTESNLEEGNVIEATMDNPFILEIGQTAAIQTADLKVTFDMVVTDVRCPTAVDCFQDGPVIVQITAEKGDGTTDTFEMNPSAEKAALQGNPPNVVTFQDYEIELTAVDPHPVQPEDILNMPYMTTIVVR
jgi:hypothetical protein